MSAAAIVEPVQEEEAEPRSRKRLIVLLVLLVLVAGGGWFYFADGAEADLEVDGDIVTLEPMTTTVGEASLHHARVALAIVLVEGQEATAVEPRIPLLQDALLRELAQMDAAAVRSVDGSDALREALTAEARQIWGDDVVRRVILTELLIN